jgi:hypothetical protein
VEGDAWEGGAPFFFSRGETSRHCDGDEGMRKPRLNHGAMNKGDAVITSIMNNDI